MNINNIYVIDALIGLKNIDDNSIDIIITSPPYDKIRDYKNNYDLNLHSVGKECFRVLKDGAMFCMVIQDGTKNFGKSCTTARTIVDYVDKIGFKLFEQIVYKKVGSPGIWWNKRFRVDHEYILLFLKGYKPKYFNKEPLKLPAKHAGETFHGTQRLTNGNTIKNKKSIISDTKCRGTIWEYFGKNERNKLKAQHPATFPDQLAKDLIICFSQEHDIVLDIFAGSGTTLRMAKESNRNFIGFEIAQEYVNIAKQLLEYA